MLVDSLLLSAATAAAAGLMVIEEEGEADGIHPDERRPGDSVCYVSHTTASATTPATRGI